MAFEELVIGGIVMGVMVAYTFQQLYGRMMKLRWPVRVPVSMQRTSGGMVWDLDERARYAKTKTGYEVLKLKKRNQNIKPPKFNMVSTDTGGKSVYPLYNTSTGQYFPISLPEPIKANQLFMEIVEDASSKNWAVLEQTRLRDTYKEKSSWWQANGIFVMNSIFAAMVIFFIIYMGSKLELSASSLGSASQVLADALKRFGQPGPSMVATTTIPASAPVVS